MRPVIQTFTGRAFNILSPTPDQVEIEDIAQSLSWLPRYTGHANRQYTVAEHSIHVAGLLPSHLKLAGLLHDAAEAYINDMSSPLKHSGMLDGYKDIETVVTYAIDRKFKLPVSLADYKKTIKKADYNMLAVESKILLSQPLIPEWNWVHELVPNPTPVKLKHWSQKVAKRRFLAAFEKLAA